MGLKELRFGPDVITYNVQIDGYCKAGEIDNTVGLLDRMSVLVNDIWN